jgi:hypothetical protein
MGAEMGLAALYRCGNLFLGWIKVRKSTYVCMGEEAIFLFIVVDEEKNMTLGSGFPPAPAPPGAATQRFFLMMWDRRLPSSRRARLPSGLVVQEQG